MERVAAACQLLIIWSLILQTIPLNESENLLIINASYEIPLIPAGASGNLQLVMVVSIGQRTDMRTKRSINMHLGCENTFGRCGNENELLKKSANRVFSENISENSSNNAMFSEMQIRVANKKSWLQLEPRDPSINRLTIYSINVE